MSNPQTGTTAITSGLMSLESADTPMHIGALLRFELPDAEGAFSIDLARALREQDEVAAPWHWRLRRGLIGRLAPSWQPDCPVDLEHHFRRIGLPAPGGERELGVLVSRLHSQPLDMVRPPWECYLIEGLAGGEFALYLKLHRALVDAAGGVGVIHAFLNNTPRQQRARAPWTVEPVSLEGDSGGGLLGSIASRPLSAGRGLGRAFGRLARAGLRRNRELALPYTAPRSALNGPVNRQRRFATQQYSLARLERLAEALDVDTEMLLLYLCGSALRRFFKEFNALPEKPMIAAVPLRSASLSDFSLRFVSLGTDIADPLKRLAAVKASHAAAQKQLQAVPEPLRLAYSLGTGMPLMAAQLTGTQPWMPAMFNLLVVDTPGPEGVRYWGGARLASIHPLSMLMPGTALTITTVYYAGTVNVGLTGARDTLPHLQRMAVYMGLALDTLEECAEAGA